MVWPAITNHYTIFITLASRKAFFCEVNDCFYKLNTGYCKGNFNSLIYHIHVNEI